MFAQKVEEKTPHSDDLLSMLGNEEEKNITNYAAASFKTTRVVNRHLLESTLKGVLDTRINHRFGYVNNGIEDLFGLDMSGC